jgi:predicted AAA+ superfamily ATPase
MIERRRHLNHLQKLLDRNPIVAILGARQVGKTTLAREFLGGLAEPYHFFDLESPKDLARLQEPELALGRLDGLVVLDEVQQLPEIFRVLRVLVDRPETRVRFLLLGSAAPELLRQSSESLAGRIAYHDLGPLDLAEVGSETLIGSGCAVGFPARFSPLQRRRAQPGDGALFVRF